MQKIVFRILFIIPLLNILVSCSHKTYPAGTYQEAAVKVDGDLSEWSEPLRFISSGGQVQYNVTNDNDNLYICLETHDEATALKILRAGVNVYIDADAGKSKNTCLSFPLPGANAPVKDKNSVGGSDANGFRQGLLAQAVSFTATGFKNMENRTYDVSDNKGIKVAIRSLAYNGLGYEAVIPMQNIFGEALGANNANRNVSVGITINALKTEGQNRSTAGNVGGMRGGGGGHMGGGRSGGGGGNYHRSATTQNNESGDPGTQTPDRTALYKADVNWYTFKLAAKH